MQFRRSAIARTKTIIIALVILGLLGVSAYVATRAPPSSSGSGESLASTSSSSETSESTSESTSGNGIGSLQNSSASYTLDLLNGTLLQGNLVANFIAQLMTPDQATNLLYDGANGYIYAIDSALNLPIVVNPETGRIISVIQLPDVVQGLQSDGLDVMALDPDGGLLFVSTNTYVPNSTVDYSWNVTVISASSGGVVSSIPIGGNTSATGRPIGMVFDPSTQELFVAMYVRPSAGPPTGYVAVLNATTDQMVGKVATGVPGYNGTPCPTCMAYDSVNGYVYLSSGYGKSIEGIDPSSQAVVSNASVSFSSTSSIYSSGSTTGPGPIVFDPTTNDLYTIYDEGVYGGGGIGSEVYALNPSTSQVTGNLSIPSGSAVGLSADTSNGDIYVLSSISSDNSTTGTSFVAHRIFALNPSSGVLVSSLYVGAGQNPPSSVFDSEDGNLYLGDGLYSALDVLDTSNNTLLASIPTAFSPGPINMDESNGNIYVGNTLANDIAVVNGSTNEVERYITLASVPTEVMWDPVNSYLYALTNGESPLPEAYSSLGANGTNDLTVINCTTNAVVKTIPAGPSPTDMAIDYYNNRISVSDGGLVNPATGNATGSEVTVVDGESNAVQSVTGLPGTPGSIVFDPFVGDVFVQYWTESGNLTNVAALNDTTGSVIATIPIGPYQASGSDPPYNAAIESALASMQASGKSIPPAILRLLLQRSNCYAAFANGKDLYPENGDYIQWMVGEPSRSIVSGYLLNACSELDTDLLNNLGAGVPNNLWGDLYNSMVSGGDIYVASPLTNSVADINDTENALRENITMASSPFLGTFVSSTDMLYFLNYGGSPDVTVINPVTDQVSAMIGVGLDPVSVQFDNSTNELYVTDMGSGNVAILSLSTNQITGYITVGLIPGNELYDPLNGNLYVCDMGSPALSVVHLGSPSQ